MNELGTLATEIVTYGFPDDTGRFPVTYISGWIAGMVGEFNGLTNEEFYVTSSGDFYPNLCPVESGIWKSLYEIEYYEKAAKDILRGLVWGGSAGFADSVTMVKEGDTTIQKVSKHSLSRSFTEMARETRDALNDLLAKYNIGKAAPVQVTGEDAAFTKNTTNG